MSAVLKALHAIQRDIHAAGIGKTRTNTEQRFNFRGIDDALYAFAPLLTVHGVLLSPRYHDIVVSPRQTKSGGTTFNVQMQGTFTFTAVEDGSERTVGPFYGEANDGQDKAVSKAESVALRQMFFHTFAVPHEPVIGGDPDGTSEAEGDYDCTDWLAKIQAASDMDELTLIADELKTAEIPDGALKAIRRGWAMRSRKLKEGAPA